MFTLPERKTDYTMKTVCIFITPFKFELNINSLVFFQKTWNIGII
jgi:hypothetical protein